MIHSLPKWGVSRRQEFSNSNPHQAPVHKGGSEEIRTNRTSLARLTSEKKPMHTQSTESCAVQPNNAQAQSLFERRFQQRLEKRIEKRRGEEAKLSNSQREHLFQTRRHWMISTYDKRLALLQTGQDCLQNSSRFAEGEDCRTQQQRAWRHTFEQRQKTINSVRERLGLSPLRFALELGF